MAHRHRSTMETDTLAAAQVDTGACRQCGWAPCQCGRYEYMSYRCTACRDLVSQCDKIDTPEGVMCQRCAEEHDSPERRVGIYVGDEEVAP